MYLPLYQILMKDDIHSLSLRIFEIPRGSLHILIANRIHIETSKEAIIFKLSRGSLNILIIEMVIIFKRPSRSFKFKLPRGPLYILIAERDIIFKPPRGTFIFKLPRWHFIFKSLRGPLYIYHKRFIHIQIAERVIHV